MCIALGEHRRIGSVRHCIFADIGINNSTATFAMHFSKTLKHSIYGPWKSNYIDYAKLKRLLRESGPQEEEKEWTEDDEGRFVEELINVQLEKVNAFQAETYKGLRERTADCESRLEEVTGAEDQDKQASDEARSKDDKDQQTLHNVLKELDNITREVNELEKYSRINFTGFLKAAKKHDRKRGSSYKVRPLLQVRLAALPFNSENYSPLLYQFVAYILVRQLNLMKRIDCQLCIPS